VNGTLSSPVRLAAGAAVLLGMLGAALATLALVDAPAGPAALGRAGPGTGPAHRSGADDASSPAGLRLLTDAAAAGVAISYEGVQVVAWWGPGGLSASVVQVWHERDRSILAQVTSIGSAASAASPEPLAAEAQDPDGVLALSPRLLILIRANYRVVEAGQGRADNRPARIVDLLRPAGGLAARYWLDDVTKLPLRRETFDSSGRMVSEDAFINLRIGDSGLRGMPAADARGWSAQLNSAQIIRLRAGGWPLPGSLPGNLRLVAAHRTGTSAGPVIDLDYSDGLSVVSVFLQRGQLPGALPGWQRFVVHGRTVYSTDPDRRSLTWSAHGFVYTVIGEAPPATVDQVVDALPHDPGSGFWGRLARGLRRLGSWANPFR
jgi:hypothetical protein